MTDRRKTIDIIAKHFFKTGILKFLINAFDLI